MSALDDFLQIGETVVIGSHTFEAEEIKTFARKFDPQPFHLDEDAARNSVFGALCASGWHTVAIWMRVNLLYQQAEGERPWTGDGPRPAFGPSPGFRKLRWLKPTFAGTTLTYSRRAMHLRGHPARPEWNVLTSLCEAYDEAGSKVLEFESDVLLKTG